MGRLAGKTALVTGASGGIGRGIAQRLGEDGAVVAVHYSTNAEAAEQTVKAVNSSPEGRAFPVQAELGVPGDVETLFDALQEGLESHGGKPELDIVVNNAGLMTPAPPEEITPEFFDRMMGLNAKAPLFIVQRALTLMPEGGRIINISAGLSRIASPRHITYAMTKGALEALTFHFARYLGPRGITVNTVAPGATYNGHKLFDNPEARAAMSKLSAFGRIGEPEDIADVVAFLASDEARWITGAFIDATGGSLLGQRM